MQGTNNIRLKNTISGAEMAYPKSTLHKLFEERASLFPNSIAIESEDRIVTYGELGKITNQIANYLWSKGLRPGQIVAISLERSPEVIASFFAVLQCGASYVPIDIMYPDARVKMMIEDSAAAFYIGLKPSPNLPNDVISLSITDILNAMVDFPTDPLNLIVPTESRAYIIYTSGSTGKPKGVQVAHCNVLNLVYSMAKEPGITAEDKIFALTSISFDPMVQEIYLPLLFGACIVIVDDDTKRDGQLLINKAIKAEITIMCGTPSIFQNLLDSGWEKYLNIKVLIGGEPMPLTLAHNLLSRCYELWNLYGPTETTVNSLLTKISVNDTTIAIGKPIANTQIYLLDTKGMPVNHGEVGEIAIAGDGVSLGYLNRPELTNERFVPISFKDESDKKMYLSGDLGKLLPNGTIQCLGRIDQQVKVRGHRIELGEIESVLNNLPEIKRATVIVSDHIGGESKLVAYLQSVGSIQETNSIRHQLEELLPEFMVPTFFMWVNDFPITANGKIDKSNLPLPEYVRPHSAPLLRKPTTKIEEEIVKIWSELLQIPIIGIDDNFFEMGGTSLTLTQLAIKLKKKFNIHITFRQLNEKFGTPALLAEYFTKNIAKEDYNSIFKTKPNEELIKIEELVEHSKTVETTLNSYQSNVNNYNIKNKPPVDGAKLGRDKEGNPAWFIENPNKVGEYIKINI